MCYITWYIIRTRCTTTLAFTSSTAVEFRAPPSAHPCGGFLFVESQTELDTCIAVARVVLAGFGWDCFSRSTRFLSVKSKVLRGRWAHSVSDDGIRTDVVLPFRLSTFAKQQLLIVGGRCDMRGR